MTSTNKKLNGKTIQSPDPPCTHSICTNVSLDLPQKESWSRNNWLAHKSSVFASSLPCTNLTCRRLVAGRFVLFEFLAGPDGTHGTHLGGGNDIRLKLVGANNIRAYSRLILKHTTIRSQIQTSRTRLYIEPEYTSSRGCALDRDANSRRPLDRLFALCDLVTLIFDLLTPKSYNL